MRLIDAEELYKGIEQQECNACESYNNVKCAACDIADCLRWVDDAPTIEAEPVKHGRWVEKPNIAYCSVCHVHWTKSFIVSLRSTYNYCPNCGARMRGDEK